MSDEERYQFPNFKVSALSGESRDEYIERANESINSQIRNQIYKNMARNGLHTLYFILEQERLGLDSYAIVESLKCFMLQLAQEDKEVGRQAEEIFEEARSRNRRKAEKMKKS